MEHLAMELSKIEKNQKKDYDEYAQSELKFPLLTERPDENRVDFFDIGYGPGESHRLDIHHLKNSVHNPVIVFIHGGGWSKRDKDQSRFLAPFLVGQGYTFISINYRLTDGDNEDRSKRNAHPAQIDDCARALKWINDNISAYGGDPQKIGLLGHSAGAHLTALLVSDTKWHEKYKFNSSSIKCWIGLSGIYDLTLEDNYRHEWMPLFIGALIDEETKLMEASPINHFKGIEPPCLLLHGSNDYLVPVSSTIHLYDRLLEKGIAAEIGIIKDAAHMNYFSKLNRENQRASKLISHFLDRMF